MHHRIDDSPDDIDMDLDHRFRPNSGLGGRIILLGDGTEISTESADSDMFDHDDEDQDLESQVNKFSKEKSPGSENTAELASRNTREETPAPNQGQNSQIDSKKENAKVVSPSTVKTEKSETVEEPKSIPATESRVPEQAVEGASEK